MSKFLSSSPTLFLTWITTIAVLSFFVYYTPLSTGIGGWGLVMGAMPVTVVVATWIVGITLGILTAIDKAMGWPSMSWETSKSPKGF